MVNKQHIVLRARAITEQMFCITVAKIAQQGAMMIVARPPLCHAPLCSNAQFKKAAQRFYPSVL